jgi:hypothetical protein
VQPPEVLKKNPVQVAPNLSRQKQKKNHRPKAAEADDDPVRFAQINYPPRTSAFHSRGPEHNFSTGWGNA